MTTIAPMNSAALLILQQANSVDAINVEKSTSADLAALANGMTEKIGLSAQPGRAESKITEAMFSVNNVNINKLKMDLIERTAEAIGFDRDDYETDGQFSSAMRTSIIVLAKREGGNEIISAIEKELGLDELGVTLLDVVSSARNPDLDDKVTEALKERAGVDKKDDVPNSLSIQEDENGVYSVLEA